jgi:hypothetical protein
MHPMGVLSVVLGLIISLAGPTSFAQEMARRNARKEALGGFEIGRIMAHDLLIPIPSIASHSREGR